MARIRPNPDPMRPMYVAVKAKPEHLRMIDRLAETLGIPEWSRDGAGRAEVLRLALEHLAACVDDGSYIAPDRTDAAAHRARQRGKPISTRLDPTGLQDLAALRARLGLSDDSSTLRAAVRRLLGDLRRGRVDLAALAATLPPTRTVDEQVVFRLPAPEIEALDHWLGRLYRSDMLRCALEHGTVSLGLADLRGPRTKPMEPIRDMPEAPRRPRGRPKKDAS
jgi:hypothetical protein